ncbi:hypothetical protein I4F81_001978 [Pyropia yezoensis]|uniref:Uncharacterized protein n=1 Tax=Pyropia yezoensis TaxID=2788 RepID=A0ACC3BNA3_PYRYE|nr:hypothetical protein I4F81_001978 [Neopyropia yezoensis]
MLARAIDAAGAARDDASQTLVFIGCGCGRALLAAALVHRWGRVVGLEADAARVARVRSQVGRLQALLARSRLEPVACEVIEGDYRSYAYGGADLVCPPDDDISSTAAADGLQLRELSDKLGEELRHGAKVIVFDARLRELGLGWAFARLAHFVDDAAYSWANVYMKLNAQRSCELF